MFTQKRQVNSSTTLRKGIDQLEDFFKRSKKRVCDTLLIAWQLQFKISCELLKGDEISLPSLIIQMKYHATKIYK
ncbi:MAG: hypothetical protein CMO01_02975 [Thalassobius sp.]|nr:hypothetical protein [Thalassovita sp.]